MEDSSTDQSRAVAGPSDDCGVRLHGTPWAASVVAARAHGSVGVRDAAGIRLRCAGAGQSSTVLPCVAWSHRFRGSNSPAGCHRRRCPVACKTVSQMVDVEPDGPLRPRTREGIDVGESNLKEGFPDRAIPKAALRWFTVLQGL